MKILLALLVSFSLAHAAGPDDDPNSDANYDHLDGTGQSGKTVNVIDWEGNMEIHVYPPGSLQGLSLLIDDTNKGNKAMVIVYRFDVPPALTRRAVLTMPLTSPFNVYKDSSVADFDKIIITNKTLKGNYYTAYKLGPKPTQLYPDPPKKKSDPSAPNSGPNSGSAAGAGSPQNGASSQVAPSGTRGGAGGQAAKPSSGSDGDKGLGTFGF